MPKELNAPHIVSLRQDLVCSGGSKSGILSPKTIRHGFDRWHVLLKKKTKILNNSLAVVKIESKS